VRIGNAASEQFQLDVFGEVVGVASVAAEQLELEDARWPRWRAVVEYVEHIWREPDDGIWEARGPRRHFTHSKVMVFDRAISTAERLGLDAPLERWRRVAAEIHDQVDAIRSELGRDGFVARYSTADTDDGLPGSEGQFLACSFWLVSALAVNGRVDDARALFERLLALANDVGLLAEEYDLQRRRQVGNFPQAFSHLALIDAARVISAAAR
jgi:GH15 family glucan-1,4-alpha-glucosidase